MKNLIKQKRERREARQKRGRAKFFGTAQSPRLAVFRSNAHISAQLINDEKGHTLASASDRELKEKKIKKTEAALLVGELLATKAKDLKIKKAIFDRGGLKYHGRVKNLAEGSRKGGLKF